MTVFFLTLVRLLWIAFRPAAARFNMSIWMRATARLQHFVLADDSLRLYGLVQLCPLKLPACDVGQHHPVAPGKSQLTLVRPGGLHQLRVAVQRLEKHPPSSHLLGNAHTYRVPRPLPVLVNSAHSASCVSSR